MLLLLKNNKGFLFRKQRGMRGPGQLVDEKGRSLLNPTSTAYGSKKKISQIAAKL
jgi:hypothetical protein